MIKHKLTDREQKKGLIEITRQLNKDGLRMDKGGKWEFRMVRLILQNVSYTGNVVLQKYVNRELKHPVINNGYEDQYFVPDTHEAIVSYEDWERVQTMLHQHKARPEWDEIQPFKGNVFCQETGLPFWHNAGYWHRKDKRIASWQGDPVVKVKSIPTYALQEASQAGSGDLIRIEVKPDSSFNSFFSKETIRDFHWTRHISQPPRTRCEQSAIEWQTRATSRWKGKSGSLCCFVKCGTCGKNYQSFPAVDDRRYRLSKCKHNPAFYQKDMEALVADVLGLDEFSEEAMDKELSHCVVNGNEVTFHFWDGRTETRVLPDVKARKVLPEINERTKSRWKSKAGSLCCFAKCGTCGKNFKSYAVAHDRRYRLNECKHHQSFYQKDMEALVIDVLGLDQFSEEAMDKELSHCVVNDKEVTFHFWDGRTERRMLNG